MAEERSEVATKTPERRVRVITDLRVNRALQQLEHGVPEYVANTTYEEIHQAALAMISEGKCPTCRGPLGLAGWCTNCNHAWTCSGIEGHTEIVLETRIARLRWSLEPL